MSNDNSGALFRNERKQQDNHPDHTGSATIGGVEYWMNGWVKEKNGKRYFSLAFKPKEERRPVVAPSRGNAPVEMSDDIPFSPEWR